MKNDSHTIDTDDPIRQGDTFPTTCEEEIVDAYFLDSAPADNLQELFGGYKGLCEKCKSLPHPKRMVYLALPGHIARRLLRRQMECEE